MTVQFTPAADRNASIEWQSRPGAAPQLRLASDGPTDAAGCGSVENHPFALQHAFTQLAAGNDRVARDIRRTIAVRRAVLRASLTSGVDSLATRRTASLLADDVVVGAFRVAHARIGGQARSMRLPLTLVATGAYGRCILSPLERPTLAILIDKDADGAAPLIDTALALLDLLGFPVDHTEPTAGFDPAESGPHSDALVHGARVLWGRHDHTEFRRRAS